MRMFRNTVLTLVFVGASIVLMGCGSATRNDQGTAFTFLGWFTAAAGGTESLPQGELGKTVPLSFGPSEVQGDQFSQDSAVNVSGAVFSFAGVQNNLTDQFVRVERIHHEYFIPGASAQPPDTSVVFSAVVGPAIDPNAQGFDSSLPDSFSGNGNRLVGGAMVVPNSVMEWLNFNRTALPELPFVMNVSSYVEGVTSAGDLISTNRISYTVQFVPDNVIAPTPADTGTNGLVSDVGGAGKDPVAANGDNSSDPVNTGSDAGGGDNGVA